MRGRRTPNSVLIAAALIASSIGVASSLAQDADVEKEVVIDVFAAGKLKVPTAFRQVQPQSRIVQYEFQAAAGEGDKAATARVTMMRAGGDVKANVRRWKGQFAGGDKAANKTEKLSVGKWTVHIVDLNGSYAERMGGGPFAGGKVVQRENYAMTGAIIIPPDVPAEGPSFFIKMIGPSTVVKANRERLIEMIKGIDN
jgi:hypothetical protein